ncbi:hypothetical protein K8O93_01105 [Gordonia bronchialis]|uniref:hypothetical protein n=1 Tax=Gordonia bronchialis TaxID=2054 RepID=UPI001CBEE347|nr:hypothetical protein [Gordonia bronchialis]UAK38432.1 hypothetical protein K8O93_01105 [Gordonia bronchialis]
MSLHFPLRVGAETIGHFEAVRIKDGPIPVGRTVDDAVNTYRVALLGGGTARWSGEVQHRYGDGAWSLVATALDAHRADTGSRCTCARCAPLFRLMRICDHCGSKRCPRTSDHHLDCEAPLAAVRHLRGELR